MRRGHSGTGATGRGFTRATGRSGVTGGSIGRSIADAERSVGAPRYTAVSPFIGARDGICTCISPLTDEDAGVYTIADDDDDGWRFCWRCRRQIAPEDL